MFSARFRDSRSRSLVYFSRSSERPASEVVRESGKPSIDCEFGFGDASVSTSAQDRSFLNDVIGVEILEKASDWIGRNMEPEDVFSESALREHARNNFEPEDIFTTEKLKQWAEENGFSEPE